MLVPVGRTAGIKLFADGVLIVGISRVMTDRGEVSPAEEAGIKPGDLIVEIDGQKTTDTESLRTQLQNKAQIKVVLMRAGEREEVLLKPAKTKEDGTQKLGAWVRDSMAGIGTVTYYDPKTKTFGALGHGINDVDTGTLMPLATGTMIQSEVDSIQRGEPGSPGELKGSFTASVEYGHLLLNTEQGIFGTLDGQRIPVAMDAIPVAVPGEITTGKAIILANVEGNSIETFEIMIRKIDEDPGKTSRDMAIEITDPRLLEKTGGIVQGMSGSPIIQNGRLIGAVTHVLINEPQKGYAISIGRMLEVSDTILPG